MTENNKDSGDGAEGLLPTSQLSPLEVMIEKLDILATTPSDQESSFKEKMISERVDELMKNSRPKVLSLITGAISHGFINPDSEVKSSFFVPASKINDNEIYQVLISTIIELRKSPGWKELSTHSSLLPSINLAVGKYFGNHYVEANTISDNHNFYGDHASPLSEAMSIRELRGKGLAVCVDKAPVAQNMLTFLGFDSELIFSSNCKLSDNLEDESHAYIIIKTKNGIFIYDPTNPIKLLTPDDEVHSTMPALYRISSQDYESIMLGGRVEVEHHDVRFDNNDQKPIYPVKRVYGGPGRSI